MIFHVVEVFDNSMMAGFGEGTRVAKVKADIKNPSAKAQDRLIASAQQHMKGASAMKGRGAFLLAWRQPDTAVFLMHESSAERTSVCYA